MTKYLLYKLYFNYYKVLFFTQLIKARLKFVISCSNVILNILIKINNVIGREELIYLYFILITQTNENDHMSWVERGRLQYSMELPFALTKRIFHMYARDGLKMKSGGVCYQYISCNN